MQQFGAPLLLARGASARLVVRLLAGRRSLVAERNCWHLRRRLGVERDLARPSVGA
jgi:hypothetical protein